MFRDVRCPDAALDFAPFEGALRRAAYVLDAAGVAAVVTCRGSARFCIERSALFPPPE